MTGPIESCETCSFYSPIYKSPLKTFADTAKKTKFVCGKGGVVTGGINPKSVLRQVRLLAMSSKLCLYGRVFSHPIGLMSMGIFAGDGIKRNTN